MWIRAALVPFAGRRLVAGQGHRRLLTTSLRAHEGAAQTDETQDEYPAWTPDSRRVGLVAKKLGMTATWDDNNRRVTLTALQVRPAHWCSCCCCCAACCDTDLPLHRLWTTMYYK